MHPTNSVLRTTSFGKKENHKQNERCEAESKQTAGNKRIAKKPSADLLALKKPVARALAPTRRKLSKRAALGAAKKHQFTPPPNYPSEWWKTKGVQKT